MPAFHYSRLPCWCRLLFMQKSREQKTTLRLAEGARWESNIFSFGSGCRYPRGISYYFSFVIISSCIRLLYFFTSSLALLPVGDHCYCSYSFKCYDPASAAAATAADSRCTQRQSEAEMKKAGRSKIDSLPAYFLPD